MKTYHKYLIAVAILGGGFLLLGWRRKAANAAIDFIDVAEVGNNQGWTSKVFQQMMKSVGWKNGEAWCMYLAKAIYLQAFPKRADQINAVMTGSTQATFKAAQESSGFRVITEGKPKVGDIVIWQSTKNAGLGHAGIVYRHEKGNTWATVEGNASLDGDRDGQGVVKGVRNLEIGSVEGSLKVIGFIRMKLL